MATRTGVAAAAGARASNLLLIRRGNRLLQPSAAEASAIIIRRFGGGGGGGAAMQWSRQHRLVVVNTTASTRRASRNNSHSHHSRLSFSTESSSSPANKRSITSASANATAAASIRDGEDDEACVQDSPSSSSPVSKEAPASPPPARMSAASAYASLAKARLSALVVTTTAAGFVAAGGPISSQLDVLGACVAGTALCASSAAAFNQVVEVEQDRKMRRTQQRPIVAGDLTVAQASVAATAWGVAGTGILYAGCDPLTAFLGGGNVALYAGVYTAMKPRSVYNTWVGAVVGAIPPVMGYSAATGGMIFDLHPAMLAATLYLWQMPHFFALSYMYRADYKRGGFMMVPCLEEDGARTSELITRYTWYLSAVPLVSYAAGATSSMFALEGVALNAYFLRQAYKFQGDRTNANARKVFLTSLWYLPCLLMLYLLHSKVWDEDEVGQKKGEDDDALARLLSDAVHGIRNKGRDLCLHEVAVSKSTEGRGGDACPVTVASKKSEQGVEAVASAAASTAATLSSEANREA